MATISKLPSGGYRVQIRRKGRYASETFHHRDGAHKWVRQAETRVDQGLTPNKSSAACLATFDDLVDLHVNDMCAVGKPPRRSKAATLATLKYDLGKERFGHIDRAMLIAYGRKRASGHSYETAARSLPIDECSIEPADCQRTTSSLTRVAHARTRRIS
ncbi:hypothetical protein [Sedimentitalea todarodis]|uniref:Integrase n=1 Tax=Sedimentitalea todarodis TaxID=1631240 RepID=A0ABU3VJQ3_9RHOB|nr:hypothetical protein [Sedimentitalea todarodis]MDU9006426.1 hypothetical protein [Sedimentitalea todarodis]